MRNYIKYTWLVVILTLGITADQFTKTLAKRLLNSLETYRFNEILSFYLVENHAGFLGVFINYPTQVRFFILYICVAILLLCCLFYLFRFPENSLLQGLPLALVTAGGLSNLLDRILNDGGVTDFIILGTESLRTGIFNLADVFILFGSFALGFLYFYNHQKH